MRENFALPRIQAIKEAYQPPLEGRADRVAQGNLPFDFNEKTVNGGRLWLPGGIQPERYPEYGDLPDRIADYAGVRPGQVMITNGTDQAIDVIVRTFADVGDTVIISEPTFPVFNQQAQVAGNKIIGPGYEEGTLAFPTQAILDAVDENTNLVIICNPNNPTGTLAPAEDIELIAKEASGAVVYVDEAYFEFSKQTAVPLIDKHPNIVVSRTFSKAFGLAGLRIGYVAASQVHINEMLKVRGPYDVNQVAINAASEALLQVGEARAYAREVMDSAKPMLEEYFDDRGVVRWPSGGNFILFRPDERAERVTRALGEAGIWLRPQHKPPIEDTLRVTIGTVEQMERFIKTYDTVIKDIRGQRSN